MWSMIKRRGCSLAIGAAFPLPPGSGVEERARELRFMMSRHPSLRTRLLTGPDGRERQSVAASGEIALDVIDAGDDDPASAADSVYDRFHSVDYDYVNEWPVRMALIRSRGALTHWVVMYSHVAADGSGLAALVADLATMDPVTGTSPSPLRGEQPLDQARWEATPAGRRRGQAALLRWERLLRAIPASRFGDCGAARGPRFRQANFFSPAMYAGIRVIADRHDKDTAAVLLTAFATAQARVTRISPSVMQIMVGNRFRRRFADTVSTVTHPGLCVIDTTGITFDQAVALAQRRTFAAYKNAYYDPAERDELIARISRERGEDIDLACYFNDRRNMAQETDSPLPAPEDLRQAALEPGTLRWRHEPLDPVTERFEIGVENTPGIIELRVSADTRYMSAAHMEAFAREMEAAVVHAALGPGHAGSTSQRDQRESAVQAV